MSGSPILDPWSPAWITRLLRDLADALGPQGWWPGADDDERLIGMLLVQRTNWSRAEEALRALRERDWLSLKTLAGLQASRIEPAIKPAGMARQKAERLTRFARAWLKLGGTRRIAGQARAEAEEEWLMGHVRPAAVPEARLLELPGVGRETAACILVYVLGVPTMVVDAYTWRILRRVDPDIVTRLEDLSGVRDRGSGVHTDVRLQLFLEQHFPAEAPLLGELHAWFIAVHKAHCHATHPSCGGCPLLTNCASGQRWVQPTPRAE